VAEIFNTRLIEQISNMPITPLKPIGDVDPAVAAEFASLLQTTSVKSSGTDMTTNKAVSATMQTNGNPLQSAGPISALPPLPSQEKDSLLPSPLLGALNDFSSEYQKNVATVHETLAAAWDQEEGIGGLQMLETQRALADSSTALAIASKVAGSLTNGINQLVKTQ
jgi:hypothetical protein